MQNSASPWQKLPTPDAVPDVSPTIPAKRYFTIGEVSRLCALKSHVLRYWEQEFPQLQPNKRRGNRRYYQRQDVELICQIRHLLYKQGFTIEGARQQLAQQTATTTTVAVTRTHLTQLREQVAETLQLLRTPLNDHPTQPQNRIGAC